MVTAAIGANGLLIPPVSPKTRGGYDLAVRSTTYDAVACPLHQTGAQAAVASTSSVWSPSCR